MHLEAAIPRRGFLCPQIQRSTRIHSMHSWLVEDPAHPLAQATERTKYVSSGVNLSPCDCDTRSLQLLKQAVDNSVVMYKPRSTSDPHICREGVERNAVRDRYCRTDRGRVSD